MPNKQRIRLYSATVQGWDHPADNNWAATVTLRRLGQQLPAGL
jgi:hypothetical protein